MEVQHQEHAHVPGSGAQPAAAASTALRDSIPDDMQAMAPEYTIYSPASHGHAIVMSCVCRTAVCFVLLFAIAASADIVDATFCCSVSFTCCSAPTALLCHSMRPLCNSVRTVTHVGMADLSADTSDVAIMRRRCLGQRCTMAPLDASEHRSATPRHVTDLAEQQKDACLQMLTQAMHVHTYAVQKQLFADSP